MGDIIIDILQKNKDLILNRNKLDSSLALIGIVSNNNISPSENCENVYYDAINSLTPRKMGQAFIYGTLYVEPERFRLITQYYIRLPSNMSDIDIINNILSVNPPLQVNNRLITKAEIKYVIECLLQT